jgi:hypothetical protein
MASSPPREQLITNPAAAQKLIGLTSLLDPWAVRAAATFRLPDLVAEGADTIAELAIRSETHPDGLGRLMRHLALLGLFRATADGRFEVAEMGEALRDGHPMGIRSTLDQTNPFLSKLDQSAHGLLQAVRTGGPAWEHLHGLSFWDNMTAEPGFGEGYDAQMNQHSAMFGAAVARSYDWSSVRHVIDVGGGVGRTLAALLSEHPHLRGTLVDLPGPAAEAADLFEQAGVADRCAIVQQSFLDALPKGGDAYLAANVVHNWDDEGAARLLRRCAEAAGPGGRVLLVERIAAAATDEARQAVSHLDLFMLTTSGGRERGMEELCQLGATAGLEHRQTHALANCPWLSLLEYAVAAV